MTLFPSWPDIMLRLALATVAGAIIGWNRGVHGRPAGLRTNLLACLAAAFAMVLANLLMSTTGKDVESIVRIDVMRLPLGILSGIGFIGGGAILHRGDLVMGVTTAATIWFVTVMGLCFGSGELILGGMALFLGVVVLWVLKWAELRLKQERRAQLTVTTELDQASPAEIEDLLKGAGFRIAGLSITHRAEVRCRTSRYDLRWDGRIEEKGPPPAIETLFGAPGIRDVVWNCQ